MHRLGADEQEITQRIMMLFERLFDIGVPLDAPARRRAEHLIVIEVHMAARRAQRCEQCDRLGIEVQAH